MALLDINWNPSAKQLRQFSLLLAAVLIGAAAWLYWKSLSPFGSAAALTAAIVAGGIGLLRPSLMRIVYVVWMAAVFPIGWTVSHVLLAAIYYLVIAPIGVIMRCVRLRSDAAAFRSAGQVVLEAAQGSGRSEAVFQAVLTQAHGPLGRKSKRVQRLGSV